jgi:hypothetical protein
MLRPVLLTHPTLALVDRLMLSEFPLDELLSFGFQFFVRNLLPSAAQLLFDLRHSFLQQFCIGLCLEIAVSLAFFRVG